MDAREGILTEDTPHVLWVGTVADAIDQLETTIVDVDVLRDATLLEALLPSTGGVPVVVLDDSAAVTDAVRYIRMGAHDVATAPNAYQVIEAAADVHRSTRS